MSQYIKEANQQHSGRIARFVNERLEEPSKSVRPPTVRESVDEVLSRGVREMGSNEIRAFRNIPQEARGTLGVSLGHLLHQK